jgi:hypothetical protein
LRSQMVSAEQVHGVATIVVGESDAGRGAYANGGSPPVSAADALMTRAVELPMLLCFADCVPVILAAPGPSLAIVHAGWRGALGGIAGACAAHRPLPLSSQR